MIVVEPERLFEILMKASAALVTFGFAAVVLGQAPRRASNRFLAVFLFLISANQLVETWIALGKVESDIGWWGLLLPPFSMTTMDRLALVFAAADPFVLYYFASIYPRRSRLNDPALVAPVFVGSVVFLVLAQDFVLARDAWLRFAWESFTAVVYLVVWIHFARPLMRGGAHPGARPIFYAMSVAALPLVPRVGRAATALMERGDGGLAAWLFVVGPSLAIVASLIVLDRTRWRSQRFAFSKAGALVGGVILIGFMSWFMNATPFLAALFHMLPPLPWYQASAALRWLVFSVLVSVAVFRHDILGMDVAVRRYAARGSVLFALFIGLAFVYATLGLLLDGVVRIRVFDVALVAAVVALSPDVRRFVARHADRLYGVPPAADRGAAAEAYRAAVAQALRDGRVIAVDEDLARLRRSLDLGAETAEWIESSLRSEPSERLLEVGSLLQGRYRVTRFLGRGASGRAFLARDPLLHRDVVLKEVLETMHLHGDRLLEEGQAAAKVQHPNVVALYDVIPQTGRVVMVTEFVRSTLQERIAREGPLPLDTAAALFSDVLSGLDAVHRAGLIHRDVKPGNIFITDGGKAKLGDFGVATHASPVTLAPGGSGVFGTPGYLAPELLADGALTPQVDVFALAKAMAACVDEDARAALADVIDTGSAPDPQDRYASAMDMLRGLHAAVAGAGTARPAAAVARRGRSKAGVPSGSGVAP